MLNLKNSYKPFKTPKTLLDTIFLVPPNEKSLVL